MRKRIIGIFVALVLIGAMFPLVPVSARALDSLDHVVISPSSANITVGGTQQFTTQGQKASNVAIPNLTYSWAVVAGGGTINNTGLFTAANTTGTYTNTVKVTAVQDSIIKIAYASVTVTAIPAKPWLSPGWSKGKKSGWQDDIPPGWSKGKKSGWHVNEETLEEED